MLRELDQRSDDGLIVTLEWDSATDHVLVRYQDEHAPDQPPIRILVEPWNARGAFLHPIDAAGLGTVVADALSATARCGGRAVGGPDGDGGSAITNAAGRLRPATPRDGGQAGGRWYRRWRGRDVHAAHANAADVWPWGC
jgi:hypothetical protein